MLQGIKNRIAGVRNDMKEELYYLLDGVVLRHNALVGIFGLYCTLALYGLCMLACFGVYDRYQNVRLNREVVKLTAERDFMAHKLDATLGACAQEAKAVVEEVSMLRDKFRKIETAQAKLTAKLVAMSTPKPTDDAPVQSEPQTQATPAEAIVATSGSGMSHLGLLTWLRHARRVLGLPGTD